MSFNLEMFLPDPDLIIEVKGVLDFKNFPRETGVYVMMNLKGEISYTGKAKNIRNRIKQHILKSHNVGLKKDLESGVIKEIKIFICRTELDAIVLERYFIESGIYTGENNIQFAKVNLIKEFDIQKEEYDYINESEIEIESYIEYKKLLRKEKREVEKMLENDLKIKNKWLDDIEKMVEQYLYSRNYEECANIFQIMCYEYFSFYKHRRVNFKKLYKDLNRELPYSLKKFISFEFRKYLDENMYISCYKISELEIFINPSIKQTKEEFNKIYSIEYRYVENLKKEEKSFIKKYVS
jgi:hypothetical protein